MKLSFVVVALFISAINAANVPSPPQSVPTYHVSGIITLPYAEINEPFEAWYDETQFASRIDYYGGMVSTIQLAPTSSMDYGVGIKVAPMTTEDVVNQKTCFWLNGTQDSPVQVQTVLPDVSNFTVSIRSRIKSIQIYLYKKQLFE